MKKIYTAALLLCSCFAQAQTGADYLRNKLYIVSTRYPYFDSAFKSSMTRLWTVSEIAGYVSPKEAGKLAKSPENSFAQPMLYTWSDNTGKGYSRSAHGIYFYQGKKKEPRIGLAEKTVYFGGDAGDNYDSAVYRLDLMVRGIVNEFKYANVKDSVRAIYNLTLLKKDKILLLNARNFSEKKKYENITADAFSNYPYKIEVASSQQIAAYIAAKDSRYVFAVPTVNDFSRAVELYDVATGFFIGFFERSGMLALPIRQKDVDHFVEKINK
ncbi:MAG: hypothetical protein JWQ27_3106 [Ferruginibacter sp.]|nr:hypothetical protein [Ferruginibacter sp.]